jgi:hypothetical protein
MNIFKVVYVQNTFNLQITVSDKIKTTYGFDSGVYLVILAILSILHKVLHIFLQIKVLAL